MAVFDFRLRVRRGICVGIRPVKEDYRRGFKQGCQMAKFDPFPSTLVQSKERKGSNFAAQRSGAIVQKPEGPNTYDLKIRL